MNVRNKYSVLFSIKGRKKGKWFVIGLIINLLLLFSLSLASYFRPYHAHKNTYMEENCFSVELYSQTYQGEEMSLLKQQGQKHAHEIFSSFQLEEKLESMDIAFQFSMKDALSVGFVASESFTLTNIGYLPPEIVRTYQKGEDYLLYIREKWKSLDFDFPQQFTTKTNLEEKEKNNFAPLYQSQSGVLLFQEEEFPYLKDNIEGYSIYCTYHLSHDISDKELLRLANLSSMASSFLSPIVQSFYHQAEEYAFLYVPIRSIVEISLYLCSLVFVISLISALLSDYLSDLRQIQKLRMLRIMGMNDLDFSFVCNSCVTIPFLLSEIISLLLYLLFMLIFYWIKGFTFFFSWPFLFLFLGEILFCFLIEYVFERLLKKHVESTPNTSI